MTNYIGYNTIKDALVAGWNDGVITVPSFEDGGLSHEDNMDSCIIRVFPSKADFITTGVGTKDNIVTLFNIRCIAKDKTDGDLYLGEIRRIINVKITNGWRHIDDWRQDKTTDFFIRIIDGQEVLRDFA